MPAEDLDVAERLYALPPEEFTAARDAAVKQADGKQQRAALKALRRPSPSAWVVNLLARAEPDLLDQLLALGPALAQAQSGGQGEQLRALGRQRRELVGAVTGTAVDLAGRPVSAAVRAEVEQTLEAALTDPAAADAVRSGRLVRPLSYAGLGDVDVQGAVAARPAAATPRPPSNKQEADGVRAAEQRALDAAAALDDAVRACERVTAAAATATRQRDQAEQDARAAAEQRERLERELEQARAAEQAAGTACDQAGDAAEAAAQQAAAAGHAVVEAQDTAERARAELARLRRT